MMRLLRKDQCITVDVQELVYAGDAVAYHEGNEVFVQRGVPGDKVSVRIVKVHDTTAHAEIEEIITPSPFRIRPECEAFHDGCGGCQWLQINYETQLTWKKQVVEQEFRPYESLAQANVRDVVGMEIPFFYRNKMVVRIRGPQDQLRVGFHTPVTKWVINTFNKEDGQCYIQNDLNNRLGRGLAASLVQKRLPLKSATIRTSEEDEVSLDLDRKLTESISADLKGIGQQAPEVHYTIDKIRFRVTSPSFFQANTIQAGTLVRTVLGMLEGRRIRTAIDVYCGVGLFSLFIAGQAECVYGIEESRTAIDDAAYNAEIHGISNVRFIRGKAEEALLGITAEEGQVDAVIVDPPRSGCDINVLNAIGDSRPDIFIYVSCNVKTLARDLAILHEKGLVATEVQPVDMFPHTYHIECVVLCEQQ